MRDGNPRAAEALSRQGRYQHIKGNLRVKEVRVEATPGVRWVICHNVEEAVKNKTGRGAALARLGADLERIAAARAGTVTAARTAVTARARTKADAELAGRGCAECTLRDHPTLGRWLRQRTSGRLVIDKTAGAASALVFCSHRPSERVSSRGIAELRLPVTQSWLRRVGRQVRRA